MEYGVFNRPVVTIYEKPGRTKETEKGVVSAIADEGLYGMACRILERDGGWNHILTGYGYAGYVREEELLIRSEEEIQARREADLAVVDSGCADVLSLPCVQGVCLASLPGGAFVERISRGETTGAPDRTPALAGQPAAQEPEDGWTRVRLLSGAQGYMRTRHLEEKRCGEDFLWKDAEEALSLLRAASSRSGTARGGDRAFSLSAVLKRWYGGSEQAFRENLTAQARKYLGTQYRWGGKSNQGIDCSGLTSMAYLRSGVLIYRDAAIADGFPVIRLSMENGWEDRLEPGDLLYFPGHIAMYLGEGRYIHSTAYIKSGGVAINSLRKEDEDYRADLRESVYAVGGVRL